ncbi:phage tail tape measure protein [Ochrobactrum grignonense]|nr:phage tail tape measure protein [Brucella grignonensis]
MLTRPVAKALSYDETLTFLAGTMAGDGSVEDKQAAKVRASDSVNRSLQESGGTRDSAAAALNTLVGSGLFEGDSALQALTPILKTAFASGANPEDVARMGVAFKNSGINSSEDMQLAFDSALRAGQLGGFELRDMARWLPGQLALARGSGLTGLDAVKYLAAANQTQIKTAGSPDEAGNNLVNTLQKLNSRELQKQMADQVKARTATLRMKMASLTGNLTWLSVGSLASQDRKLFPKYLIGSWRITSSIRSYSERLVTPKAITSV